MDLPVVALECPKCGARLEVTPELEMFACGYCGASVRVRRAGGTVSLQRIEARLSEVERHTDQTAAELAIVRYEKDLTRVEAELANVSGGKSTMIGAGCGCGLLLLMVGIGGAVALPAHPVSGLFIVLGIAALVISYRAANPDSGAALRQQRDELRRRIAERRKVADGAV